jgi:hypothetical protein
MGMVNTLKRLMRSFFILVMIAGFASSSSAAVKFYAQDAQPATCTKGDMWTDTNGTSSERIYSCESTNTWVKQVGNGPTSNPSLASLNVSGGNLAANNMQVTKAWMTGLSYTDDETSVIHGGQHYICTSSHTAGATTEPGVGGDWATVWAIASGSGGFDTSGEVVALFGGGSCSGYLKSDGTCATPSGTGDMVLSTAQSVTGAKTFDPSMLLMKGSSTGKTTIATANAGASDYTITLPAVTGTMALIDSSAYDATNWNNSTKAPDQNAVRDWIESLPNLVISTGLTDNSGTVSVTNPVTAEAFSGSGWNADTEGLTRNDAYDYLHIGDTDDDGLVNKVDLSSAGLVKTDSSGVLSVATAGTDYEASTPSTKILTSSDLVSASDFLAAKYLSNYGAAGTVAFTLPAVSYNISRAIISEEPNGGSGRAVSVCPPSGEAFSTPIGTQTADECISATAAVGSTIIATRYKTGAATWAFRLDPVVGTWTEVGTANISAYLTTAAIDDTPDNSSTTTVPSANWANDHAALASSDTVVGHVEMATIAETSAGTDATRAVSPDGLAGSVFGTKEIGWTIKDSDVVTAVADGKQAAVIPASLNGMNLVDLTCSVSDLNSAASGTTTVVLRRVRGATAVDMTSTGITIAYNEYTASDETVDTANDDVATGDKIFVDVNAVTSAAQKGLYCTASFQLP